MTKIVIWAICVVLAIGIAFALANNQGSRLGTIIIGVSIVALWGLLVFGFLRMSKTFRPAVTIGFIPLGYLFCAAVGVVMVGSIWLKSEFPGLSGQSDRDSEHSDFVPNGGHAEILREFYVATNGDGWMRSQNWGAGNVAVQEWHGVAADDLGYVTKLDLSDNGLKGNDVSSLCNIRSLQALDLSGNELNGAVPDCLLQLPDLRYLDLSDCAWSDAPDALLNLAAAPEEMILMADLTGNPLVDSAKKWRWAGEGVVVILKGAGGTLPTTKAVIKESRLTRIPDITTLVMAGYRVLNAGDDSVAMVHALVPVVGLDQLGDVAIEFYGDSGNVITEATICRTAEGQYMMSVDGRCDLGNTSKSESNQ